MTKQLKPMRLTVHNKYQFWHTDYDSNRSCTSALLPKSTGVDLPLSQIRQGKASNTGVPSPLRVWVNTIPNFDNPDNDFK